MSINLSILNQAALAGSENAGKALSAMTGREIKVELSNVNSVPLNNLVGLVTQLDASQVVAYSQLITGISGAALLVLNRADALNLADTLQGKQAGSTIVLQELDRSAIKETLNILSNSHLTALANKLGVTVTLAAPNLISREKIAAIVDYQAQEAGDSKEIVVLQSKLVLQNTTCTVNLYVLLGANLTQLLNRQVA